MKIFEGKTKKYEEKVKSEDMWRKNEYYEGKVNICEGKTNIYEWKGKSDDIWRENEYYEGKVMSEDMQREDEYIWMKNEEWWYVKGKWKYMKKWSELFV